MLSKEWILCPICGNKTRVRIRKDTELKNFPLYCPKCSRESLIEGKQVIIRTLTPKNKPSFSGGFNVIFLYKALPAGLWTRAEAGPVLPLLEMVPSGAAVPVHM